MTPPPPFFVEHEDESVAAGMDISKDVAILVRYTDEKEHRHYKFEAPEREKSYEFVIRIRL